MTLVCPATTCAVQKRHVSRQALFTMYSRLHSKAKSNDTLQLLTLSSSRCRFLRRVLRRRVPPSLPFVSCAASASDVSVPFFDPRRRPRFAAFKSESSCHQAMTQYMREQKQHKNCTHTSSGPISSTSCNLIFYKKYAQTCSPSLRLTSSASSVEFISDE